MWSQDYLAAPWTPADLFTQLTTNLTNPDAGWTVFEDATDELVYPYIIYRNNGGSGLDVLLYVDLTQSTDAEDNQTFRSFLFEYDAYTPESATIPDNVIYATGIDLDTTTNLLVTHASTPNKLNTVFWFEQGVGTHIPTSVFVIDPYKLPDGTTLVNAGDDGSSYPLWVSYAFSWRAEHKKGGSYFNRNSSNFSTFLKPTSVERPYWNTVNSTAVSQLSSTATTQKVKSLNFVATRAPANDTYAMCGRGVTWANSSSAETVLSLPNKRIDAWSGGGVFLEGFRPELITGIWVGEALHSDARGYIGNVGDVIVARSFGGALGDSFTVDGNEYRIVTSLTLTAPATVEVAIRVA